MQAGARAAQRVQARALFLVGRRQALHLVQLDTALQQRLAVLGIAGVHQRHIGGFVGIGHDTHCHAAAAQARQRFGSGGGWHEVGRHQRHRTLRRAQYPMQLVHQQATALGLGQALGRVVADHLHAAPLQCQLLVQQVGNERCLLHRPGVGMGRFRCLDAVGIGLQFCHVGHGDGRHDGLCWPGRVAGPVAVKVV